MNCSNKLITFMFLITFYPSLMLIKQQLKYLILNTVGFLISEVSKHMFILQYIYRVKTCKLITLGAYTDSTDQLRSAEKKHLPDKVYSSSFGRGTWCRTFTSTRLWQLVWSYLDSLEFAFCGLWMLHLTVELPEDYPSLRSHHPLEDERNRN